MGNKDGESKNVTQLKNLEKPLFYCLYRAPEVQKWCNKDESMILERRIYPGHFYPSQSRPIVMSNAGQLINWPSWSWHRATQSGCSRCYCDCNILHAIVKHKTTYQCDRNQEPRDQKEYLTCIKYNTSANAKTQQNHLMNPRDSFGILHTQTRYATQLNSTFQTQWNAGTRIQSLHKYPFKLQ